MPLQIPVTQTGLEASIQQAMRNAGRNAQINLGTNSRQINALSQPLGRITGQADEFTKSMEAANARVFAFGASVGIINGVSKAFGALVKNTIEVEKSLAEINTVLNRSGDALQDFGNKLFDVAKTTGQTFDTVAKGALELARQGLNTEDTLKRINDALILSRLSGLDAQQSVEGLTAAFNSFKETGITTSQILNKLVVVSQKYSVSERDLIEGLKRSASVADQAGVSFDELVGIITTVQERTARGGAVIGNAFKTIFARIQDTGALQDLANLGIQVTDLEGKILPATKILQNLGAEFNNLSQLEQADIAKKLGGVYQLSNLLAAVKDLSSEQSKYNDIVKLSAGATNEAYKKNAALNETLASLINKVTLSAQQLGATLGAIGITDSLKGLLDFFNNILEGIQKILGEESMLGDMFKGLAKGIGNVLAGPGLALFGAIIAKLSKDLISFGIESLKSFFKIGQSAKEIQSVEKAIAAALGSNLTLQRQLFALEGNRAAQIKLMTEAIVQQEAVMRRMATTAGSLAGPLYQQGVRSTGGQGLRVPKAAGGYMPAVSQESRDINRGIGGAKAGDKPVVIPNFAFGGGKKGTMVAHTGEYIVPNFAGGGSAIFNRDMVRSMGLPAGAKKIGAAGGFIPNFAEWYDKSTGKVVTSTDYPKSLGNWEKVTSNSQTYRKYADAGTLENYKLPNVDFYLFPDGTGGRGATVRGVLGRNKSKAVINTEEEQKKITEAGFFDLNADQLGGIVLVSPRFGKGVGNLDTSIKIAKIPLFNQSKFPIDKDKYINLKGVKTSNTPSGRDLQGLQGDISQLFAGGIVDLAYRLYGSTFDPASAGEFTQKLKSLDASKKEQLLPQAAQGDLFEAAGKVALNSFSNLESLFGSAEQNRPFDFQNPTALQKMFGVSVLRGEAKRGGEQNFSSSKQVSGIIKKIFNDPEYSPKALDALKAQGAFSPEMQKKKKEEEISNAIGGFIPNFVSQKYVMDTLARIKAGTSGFSKQEQETFLNKFGAKSTGRKISLREVYDKLDGDIGISALIDKAYVAAGPTASNEDVYRVFEKQIKANPYALRGLVSKKGFIPNFADPLKEAIGREMSAGVPASQIYVDQNSSLKNAMNPMGLMVANRRDEPTGGIQGISRARKEGANPMLYGAAGGFVPNYAAKIPDIAGNVKSGLGALFSTDVENAINEFGKKAIAAGGNMDKLAKALETTLKNLGANEDAAKTVADESRKQAETIKQSRAAAASEAQAKREALASKTLENQSNKKLAAQLDKIYIEYNKSQKSAADLDAAQKKAAAILQKTNLSQASQKAVISSTAGLAESRSTAQTKTQRDLLGTVFAVQAGLSFLVGMFDNAGSAFGAAASALTNVASSATSVYLLFQGLKGIGGKFGSLAGKLGIYGAAAAGLYEGFKLVAKNLDSTNASINNASFAMENFAKVAAGATVNFGTLSESQKKRIQTSREGLIEGGRRFLGYQGTVGFAGRKRAVNVATFEGYSGELEKQFKGAIDQALAVGVSYDVMFNRIRKAAESGNKITAEEVENMINEFKTLAEEIAKVKPTDFLKNSGLFEGGENEEYFKRLQKLSSEQLDTQLGLFKEKGTKSGKDIPLLQELIEKYTPIKNLKAQKEFAKVVSQFQKETEKAQEEGLKTATETASLSLLKQQLENRIAYKKALFEASSAEEYSLELQKEMLSVGEKDRTLADYKLQSLQAAKKLTSEQADATIGYLKESELIQKKLESSTLAGEIDSEKFKQFSSAAEEVGDLIREQGGYTQEVENKLQSLLTPLGLTTKQYELIRDTVKETNDEISKRLTLESRSNALSSLKTATLEAEKFVYEKRSAAITNEYDQQLKLNELRKKDLDIALEKFKVSKERQKIGGGAGGNLSVDRQIFEQEKITINAKLKIDQEDLLIQVRKTLTEAAMQVGYKPEELSQISTAKTQEEFETIVTAIENAEKEAQKVKIQQALDEAKLKNNSAILQATTVQTSANYFLQTVKTAADYFKNNPLVKFLGGAAGEAEQTPIDPNQQDALQKQQASIEALQASTDAVVTSGENQKRAIDALPKNFSGLFDVYPNAMRESGQAAEEAGISVGNLENALLSAGGSLTTFANLVRGVFTSLPETIAQNKFAMLTATDTQSIIGNAVEARRNSILAQGPASAGTIAQAADATAIYEKELEIKRAITAEDKINGEFELQKLKEILPLRMQLLEAETNEEREAIIDRIIAKEKQRLPVLQRIKAEFSSTAEERTQKLEDALVDASAQFRDNLIDGISKAVEEGGSLGDVLRSAALDFARAMTRAGLQNVTSQIGGLFGFNSGGMVPRMASGGMINGGSGMKDDVPAVLTGGEFVVNKKSVQKYGPDFLHAINNGKLGGYAKGGSVKKPTQTGAGGFVASGLYGTGSIVGKEDLLSFATQSYTSGARDVVTSGENFASVNLEPESLRLTNFGRTNDRMFQATQSAKEEAFGLYTQQLQQELDYKKQLEEYEKQKKAEKKAFRNQLITMAITAAAGPILGAAGAGFKAAFNAAGGMQNFLPSVGAGLKGIFTGGSVGGVNVGGLGNLFKGVGQGLTGNFSGAGNSFKLSQIGTAEQLQGAFNKSVQSGSGFSGFLKESGYMPQGPAIGVNGGGGGGGIFDWFNKIKSGVGGLFGGGRDIDAQGLEATGEDIKDPSQWVRGGASTAYGEGLLPPLDQKDPNTLPYLNENDLSSSVPLNAVPIIKDSGVRANYSRPLNKRYATGGVIPSTSGIDTVPAMLSGGEFIMNRAASQNIGAGNLQSLNAGASSLPTEEKTEELNDKLIAKLDELIEASGSAGSITINVEAASGKTSEQTSGDDNERRVQMARLIKDMVLKVIQDEKRLGGALRRG